jgi:hypothetical protein
LKLLKGHKGCVTAIKNLERDSSRFVSGDSNGTVLVWAPVGGKWLVTYRPILVSAAALKPALYYESMLIERSSFHICS